MGGISLNVEGQENIDTDQQYIFMVNHQSNVDIPVIVQSLARFQLRWIAKKELLWVPFFGWAMWATKHITDRPIRPPDAVKSLERAKERIAAGISVVVFPEGTRSTDGKLLRFKKGGFMLAVQAEYARSCRSRSTAARNLLPSGAWRLRPGIIEVLVDKPIAVEGYRVGKLRTALGSGTTSDRRQFATGDPSANRRCSTKRPTRDRRMRSAWRNSDLNGLRLWIQSKSFRSAV